MDWKFELNPVTLKRWQRFRKMRRARASLIILALLYLTSLMAELICNNIPLCVRFENHWYFPVVMFHPEDTFLHNGQATRPDYKALARSKAFTSNPDNLILFPPFPFSPLEIIDPESIPLKEAVSLEFTPQPRIASVTITRDFAITKASGLPPFLSAPQAGKALDQDWELPPETLHALELRWQNQPAPALDMALRPRSPSLNRIILSLPEFAPRATPPASLRLTLREQEAGTASRTVVLLDKTLQPLGASIAFWAQLSPDLRANLTALAAQRLAAPCDDPTLLVNATLYTVHAAPIEVRWPFKPVAGHWLGIDSAGRDVLARLLYGLRSSMTFGFLLVAVTMVLGTVLGALQGYFGNLVDLVGQRFTEIWSAIPFLYVMILLGSVYGRGFTLLLCCYALFNWISISYYIRAEFLRLRPLPFVEAARVTGLPHRTIILRHILPNAMTPLITFFPFYLVGAIGSLAALDYLGFGLPPPTPSWGELLAQAQQFRWAWWLILYPAGALFTVMLLGVFIGEGFRNAYDPRPATQFE